MTSEIRVAALLAVLLLSACKEAPADTAPRREYAEALAQNRPADAFYAAVRDPKAVGLQALFLLYGGGTKIDVRKAGLLLKSTIPPPPGTAGEPWFLPPDTLTLEPAAFSGAIHAAASENSVPALRLGALLAFTGAGEPRNPAAGFARLRRAADAGDVIALSALARCREYDGAGECRIRLERLTRQDQHLPAGFHPYRPVLYLKSLHGIPEKSPDLIFSPDRESVPALLRRIAAFRAETGRSPAVLAEDIP